MKHEDDKKFLLEIFITFFKIGSFMFGGGYTMLPIMEKEIIEKKKWIERELIIDTYALSQSMPGVIAINSSTFIGYKIAGRKGALAATLGILTPSFLIITIIAAFFAKIRDIALVNAVFTGIRPAIAGLIAVAAVRIARTAIRDKTGLIITFLSIILVLFLNIQAIFIIIGGLVLGVVVYVFCTEWINKKTQKRGER